MPDNIFPNPKISYYEVLQIVNQLIDELNNENFDPFGINLEQKALTERRRKTYIRKMKIDISIKLSQIKDYIIICQTYKKMLIEQQIQALNKARLFISTWKGVVTRQQFAAYQYMLWSMLNLPLNTNEQTLKVTKEIMTNPYLNKYVKAYDEKTEEIIWQVQDPKPHLHLFERFKRRKKVIK